MVLYYRAYAVWGPSTALTIFTIIKVIVRNSHVFPLPENRFEQGTILSREAPSVDSTSLRCSLMAPNVRVDAVTPLIRIEYFIHRSTL